MAQHEKAGSDPAGFSRPWTGICILFTMEWDSHYRFKHEVKWSDLCSYHFGFSAMKGLERKEWEC